MRTTVDHAGDRPEDWKAPGAELVRSAATDRVPTLADLGRVHIMGIAGSGMSVLARILFDRGLPVSGCEARESITVAGLGGVGLWLVAGVRLPQLAAPKFSENRVAGGDGDEDGEAGSKTWQ